MHSEWDSSGSTSTGTYLQDVVECASTIGIEEQIKQNRILMENVTRHFDASERLPLCSHITRTCLQFAKDYGLVSAMERDDGDDSGDAGKSKI